MTSKFYAAILLSTCLGVSACGKPAASIAKPDSPAPCGNTATAANGACDDGDVVSGKPPICGDGSVDKKYEDCDDGNTVLESCPAGQPECKVCGPACTLVAGIVMLNRAPTIALNLSAGPGLLPGQSATVTAAVNDADGDALGILWSVRSATVAGIDCYAELVTLTAGTRLFLRIPLRPTDVRCADAMTVSATVSDAAASASASVTLTVLASPLLGVAWSEMAGNPVVPLSTCPAWDCLGHSDPAIGRDESGSLVLWFSAGGDRGNHPVIGRAVQQPGGAFAFSPTEPVMEFDAAGVPPDPLPWDYVRETVSVLWNPAASRWSMTYLGYKTDYYTDPAIGLVESLDSAGALWPRVPAPIYTPSRPNGWDAAFLTSPTGLLGSDGVWRIYFAGSGYTVPGGKIGVLTSPNGITWTASPDNPIFEGVTGAWDESVIDAYVSFVGGRYLMWYSAFQGELTDTTTIEIGLATSEDGFAWERAGVTPVVHLGGAGAWNDFRVLDPEVLLEADGSLLMAGYAASTVAPIPAYPDFKPTRLGLWKSVP